MANEDQIDILLNFNTSGADKALEGFENNLKKTAKQAESDFAQLGNTVKTVLGTFGVGLGVGAFVGFLSDAVNESVKLENSLKGVESVAKSFGASTDAVKQAIIDFSKDGLVS